MSNYLVTGGAGFIGSHLVDYLVKDGHAVTVLDNLCSGKEDNIHRACKFIEGSIIDAKALKLAFNGVDVCYHLAAIPSVQKSIENWYDCNVVNSGGTVAVFFEAAKRGVPVVYVSSAAVYGNQDVVPIKEDIKIAPTSPYGLDKYYAELQAKLFGQIHGLKSICLRLFNVYGPRQDPTSPYSGVISIFVDKILNNKPITIYGEGSQERDFMHVYDVVQALIKAQDFVSTEAEVYNVCTNKGTSINQLVKILFDAFDKTVPVHHVLAKQGDIYKSIGDNTKITNVMNYVTKHFSADTCKTIY